MLASQRPPNINTNAPPLSSQFSYSAMPLQPPPTLKRKRPVTTAYRSETTVDSAGRTREVIVIDDDSPTPQPTQAGTLSATPGTHSASAALANHYAAHGVRTRAQAAAEASGSASASSSQRAPAAPPAAKRRRKETGPVASGSGVPPPHSGAARRKLNAGKAYEATPTQQASFAASASTNGAYKNGSSTLRESNGSQASVKAGPQTYDDKEGHYIIRAGDVIGAPPRYRIVRLLGQGTFGKVVEAYDNQNRTLVAVKIIRSIPKYRDASKIEVRVLKTLKQNDPANKQRCIQLLEWFDYRNHICIVTELLGKCIYDFLKENNFAPFPRKHIQEFAKQVLSSVAFLHDLHLVHTDLKPENILLVHNDYRLTTVPGALTGARRQPPSSKMVLVNTDVRLIDFGSATFENEYHSSVVSTRHYRAPEIILNMGWSYPCDAFSLGCILVEFYTGTALFQTHDNLEHLAMMEAVMGPMPLQFARKAAKTKAEYFKEGPKLDWPPRNKKVTTASKKEVKATRALAEIIPPADSINVQFQDLVRRLLHFDPGQRITVRQALAHKFFDERIPSEL